LKDNNKEVGKNMGISCKKDIGKYWKYSYWQNCQLFDNFKTFFREKVKELRFKNDLEDVSR